MVSQKSYKSVYKQFISEIENGFLLLDENSRAEVTEFVKGRQNINGAFTDRSGNSDLYYSLFGAWLSKALKLEQELKNLAAYVSVQIPGGERVLDKFTLLLIRLVLEENDFKKPSSFKLFKWIFGNGKQLNTAYRFFLFMLSFDALFGRNRFIYFLTGLFLRFYCLPDDAPGSFLAALLLAKFQTGRKVRNETEMLLTYFEKGKGFKVFKELGNADLLSTAVALFALKKAGEDLRVFAPDCLRLVQENYDCGAFLSGDGDLSRDLEYTFYGLLTLGTLS